MKSALIICLMLGVIALMQHRDESTDVSNQVADCIPSDEGEMAIQTIDNGVIRCEKHPRFTYGMAQLPTLACPIDGACNSDNLIARN